MHTHAHFLSYLGLLCGRRIAGCSVRSVLGHLALVAFLVLSGSLHRERGLRGTRVRLLLPTVYAAAFCASGAVALLAGVRADLLEFQLRLIGEVRPQFSDLLRHLAEFDVRIGSLHLTALRIAERERGTNNEVRRSERISARRKRARGEANAKEATASCWILLALMRHTARAAGCCLLAFSC